MSFGVQTGPVTFYFWVGAWRVCLGRWFIYIDHNQGILRETHRGAALNRWKRYLSQGI